MDSPFPGMDPYLESRWGDVHHSLITYARDQLQPRLPEDLRAQIQERVVIEPPALEGRAFYPDVHVAHEPRGRAAGTAATAVAEDVEVAEPLRLPLGRERTEGFIEIVEAGTRRKVVTVIEVLSPSNKRKGEGRRDYFRKRRALRAGGVSLVEIDLLRGGRRISAVPASRLPDSHRTTYHVSVQRGRDRAWAEVYRAPIRERLPKIRVPLRETDADVPLDLQALVNLAYRNGRHEIGIDYRQDPKPPLDADDAAWADALLRERGLR